MQELFGRNYSRRLYDVMQAALEHDLPHEVLSGDQVNARFLGYNLPAHFKVRTCGLHVLASAVSTWILTIHRTGKLVPACVRECLRHVRYISSSCTLTMAVAWMLSKAWCCVNFRYQVIHKALSLAWLIDPCRVYHH